MNSVFIYIALLTFSSLAYSFGSFTLRDMYADGRRYDQVTYLTTHNAFAINKEGWRNYQQSLDFDEQFAFGVWSFMLDLHWCKDASGKFKITLAHLLNGSDNKYDYSKPANQLHLASCATSTVQRTQLEHRTFEDFLSGHLKKWLDQNPDIVITLHLESYLGTDGARQLHDLFIRTGVLNYVYYKLSTDPWPTLGEMRNLNKRLVVFSSNAGDCNLREVFHTTHYRETDYNLRDFSKCELRFDNRDTRSATSLLVMNHFYKSSHETVSHRYHQINNPYASHMTDQYVLPGENDLETRTELCITQEGIYPSFIAVDHVEKGDMGGLLGWVSELNYRRINEPIPVSRFLGNLASVNKLPALYLNEFSWSDFALFVSPLFALGSYRYPWIAYPAAVLGTLGTMSWLETVAGHHIPARISLALNNLGAMASALFLYYYHPMYAFVRFAGGDHARIMLGQRHRED